MHSSFRDGSSLANLRVRDLVFFFEACETTFLVGMASLKKMLFGLAGLHFGERDER